MKNQLKSIVLPLAAAVVVVASAHAALPGSVVWAADPVGAQMTPDAQSITLLSSSGYVPLKNPGTGKCLLVARRGTQIVALELSPLAIGPKVIGWAPKEISMDALTSQWGYQPPAAWSAEQAGFSNSATAAMVASGSSASGASSWSNASVEAHQAQGGEQESAETVTVNGKTYRKYSHFVAATKETPVAASDEYFCQ
jgi:hypothetical protein